jgi:protein-disulfide isomerase
LGKRTWIIFIGVVVVLFGGLILLSNNSKINVSKVNTNQILKASAQSGNIADHVLGTAGSKVIFTEYGDYQCPYCDEAYAPIKSVTTEYSGQIAFVFRNFPLTTLHPNALAAAGAAEAAGLQGKYWQYHDLLYQNQSDWDSLTGDQRNSVFTNYAKELGLNVTKFTADEGSNAVSSKISFDQALGQKLGIDSTPSFYLDGVEIPSTVEQQIVQGTTTGLTDLINSELKKNNIALPTAATS